MVTNPLILLCDQALALALFEACFPIATIDDRNIDTFTIVLSCDSEQPIKAIKSNDDSDLTYLLEPADPENDKGITVLNLKPALYRKVRVG